MDPKTHIYYYFYTPYQVMITVVVVVVVLTLTHTVATMQSVVTGQAPITLERQIIAGGKQIKTKDNTHNN